MKFKTFIFIIYCLLLSLPSYSSNEISAEGRFAVSFSGSGIFDCWSGKEKIGLDIGQGGDNINYLDRKKKGLPLPDYKNALSIIVEVWLGKNKSSIKKFWGYANFENGDMDVSVPLNDGRIALFERFGPTPNWPFKSKKDSQLFFTFRIDDGAIYKCKAVYQPGQ